MFLQAAGMPARTTRQLEKHPTSAPLPPDLRALVALTVKATERPWDVTAADVAVACQAAGSPAKYLDAVGVMIGFNFITRVANTLGVEPEISPWVRRIEWLRQSVLKVCALALRGLVDLRRRQTTQRTLDENLQTLRGLFAAAGLGSLPDFLLRLGAAPHLLESQRELLEALLLRDNPAGPLQMDPERFRSVGLVVLQEIGAQRLRDQVAEAMRQDGREPPEGVILGFARDVTRWSYRITAERLEELRGCGLEDADLLDLVCAIALWNAFGRLEILLAGVPDGLSEEHRQAAALLLQ
jgi:alkylhydroperoxidase family enzyme